MKRILLILSLALFCTIAPLGAQTDYHAHAITGIYRDTDAYQAHLQTPHFLEY